MPSLQESVPGQLTTSVISRAPDSASPSSRQAPPDVVDGLVADPAEHEVLLDGRAGEAAGEVAHDRREAAELLGREVPARDLHDDGRIAGLPLRLDVRGAKALELGDVAVRRGEARRDARRLVLLVVHVLRQEMLDGEVALGDPVALELFVHHLAEGVHADLVDEDLDASAGAVDAEPVLAVEDAKDGLGDLEVVAVVELDELVKGGGDAGHDRGPAADPDLDAADSVALAGDEADVVDARDRDVLVGGGERRLDLPRHELRGGVAHEVADVRAGVRGDVEELVRVDARERIARDVSHRVAAALAGGEARPMRSPG